MATRDVKARVAFEGEQEYKRALNELNSGNRVLASEMKKLKAEYQGNTESVEFLTKKGDLLERQLLSQRDKVEELRKAVRAAAQANGEADQSTQDWMVKLNNAEAQMYDLEHAVEENNKAIENEGKTMVGLGDTVDGLASKLGIKIPQGAKDALNGMQGLSAGTVAAMGAAAAAVAALSKAISSVYNMTVDISHEVDDLVTESMITGLSTTTIQQLKYAEELIDVSYGTISASLTKLGSAMVKAKDGNAEAIDSFAQLGVSIYDSTGELRRSEDVFYDLIDALGRVDNEVERDALTMQLMGKSAKDLNPLILQGSGALRELAEEAQATGYVLDESQIQKLTEVDDEYQRLQLEIEATKKELAVEFAPAAKEVLEMFSDLTKGAGKALVDSGILTNLGLILENLISLLGVNDTMTNDSIPALEYALKGVNAVLGAVAITIAAIRDAADFLDSLIHFDFSGAASALGLNYGSGIANNVQRTIMKQEGRLDMYDSYYGRNATGNDNWRGGLTYVGENGPELVSLPQGSRILSAQETANAMGGDTFNITIDAKSVKEFNDIIEMAKSERVRRRME